MEVVGLTARGWDDLPERERALVSAADVVIGSPRLLALVPRARGQSSRPLPSPVRAGLPALLDSLGRVDAVMLASGDPLLSGIGSTLVELLGRENVRIHPAVSSVALARARMGWAAETTTTLSLVGRDLDLVRRHLAPGARLVVLSAGAETPARLAALLVEARYGPSELTVLGELGTDVESRACGRADGWSDEIAALNVVCVTCRAEPAAPVLGWMAGLPDEAYEHDGQLTRRDVRAAVLARLAPRPGDLLWDLGAGAGSVAIEWCRADGRCRAVAVERDEARAGRIRNNAARLGVPGIAVVVGQCIAAISELASPQAVFVGGGADADLLRQVWARLGPGARLVVSAVTVETEHLLLDAQARWGGELVRIGVEAIAPLGRYRGWVPARPVVLWSVRRAVA
jgi:precorrin-6Y C5,15-methyltransferase (decarboxylating)